MLGIVFTELLDHIEDEGSLDLVDAVLAQADVEGAYTAVGHYPDAELDRILTAYAQVTGRDVHDVHRTTGQRLFDRFMRHHPYLVGRYATALDLLQNLETHVHEEVRKLYPDSRPPTFHTLVRDDGVIELTYTSHRHLHAFAHGLLEGCFTHYGLGVDVAVTPNPSPNPSGDDASIRFTLTPIHLDHPTEPGPQA